MTDQERLIRQHYRDWAQAYPGSGCRIERTTWGWQCEVSYYGQQRARLHYQTGHVTDLPWPHLIALVRSLQFDLMAISYGLIFGIFGASDGAQLFGPWQEGRDGL